MEAADVVRVGELDHVPRAVHVGAHRGLLVCLDVVDGREVEEVVDALVEAVDTESRLREVARHGHEAIAGVEPLRKRVEPAARALADEGVHRGVAAQQLLDEITPDEAGRARDEVVQGSVPPREVSPGRGESIARDRALDRGRGG